MPTITQLEYLVAVGRTRHFGNAARECHVSQPSLSAQIHKVEEELNVVVFDRSMQPVKVTDRGRSVLEQARVVLREHQRIFELSRKGGALSGGFHLGVIPSLSPYVVPLFVETFSIKFPGIELKITELKTEDIIKELAEERMDAGLLVTPLHEKSLNEQPLFYEPFLAFVSENRALINKQRVQDSDLDGSSVWLLDEGHCFRDQVIRICGRKDRNEVLKNVKFSSGSLETLINLVRRGKGYTLLPWLATLHLTKNEKLKNLKQFTVPTPTREVSLVTSRSVLKKEVLDALGAEIRNSIPAALREMQGEKNEVIDI